jgi:hypothetical protein
MVVIFCPPTLKAHERRLFSPGHVAI